MQLYTCPCGGRFAAEPGFEGARVSCPYCHRIITVLPPTPPTPRTSSDVLGQVVGRGSGQPFDFHPGVAGVLSLFFPGAGQIYRGETGAGIVWLLAVFIGYLCCIVPGFVLHILCVVAAARR